MSSQRAVFAAVVGGFFLGTLVAFAGVLWYIEHRFGGLLRPSSAPSVSSASLQHSPQAFSSRPQTPVPPPPLRTSAQAFSSNLQTPDSSHSPPSSPQQTSAKPSFFPFPLLPAPKHRPDRPLTTEEKSEKRRHLEVWRKILQDPRRGLFVYGLKFKEEEAQMLLGLPRPLEMQRLPGSEPSDTYDAIKLILPGISASRPTFYGVSLQLWLPSEPSLLHERWSRYQTSFPMERRPLSSTTLTQGFWSLRPPLRYLVIYEPPLQALLLLSCHVDLCQPPGLRHLAELLVVRLRQARKNAKGRPLPPPPKP